MRQITILRSAAIVLLFVITLPQLATAQCPSGTVWRASSTGGYCVRDDSEASATNNTPTTAVPPAERVSSQPVSSSAQGNRNLQPIPTTASKAATGDQQYATVTVFAAKALSAGNDLARFGVAKNSPWFFYQHVYVNGKPIVRLFSGQFLTLRVPAGDSEWVASSGKSSDLATKPKKPTISPRKFPLEAGKHYFLRFATTHTGWSVYSKLHHDVTMVDCAAAIEEAGKFSPVPAKNIETDRALVQQTMLFPVCADGPLRTVVATESATGERTLLDISSNQSGSEILIDGKFVGQTPARLSIAPGEHVIEVLKVHFAPWKRTIVASDGTATISAELLPE